MMLVSPQPRKAMENIARDIFSPVKQGLCVSCHFISGAGKRTFVKFFLKEEKILKEIFGSQYQKTLFVYVDPDEILEDSNEAYLHLMMAALVGASRKKGLALALTNDNPLVAIKEHVTRFIAKDCHVVFLLNDFEYTLQLSPSIFRNLESILGLNKAKVTLVFLSTVNLLDEDILPRFHNLKYAINRVVRYRPLFSVEETTYMIDQSEEKFGVRFTQEIRDILVHVCGGHAQLIKYAITLLAEGDRVLLGNSQKVQKYLLGHPQLQTICADIWSFLQPREQEMILSIVRSGQFPKGKSPAKDYLIQTGMLQEKNGRWMLFNELF